MSNPYEADMLKVDKLLEKIEKDIKKYQTDGSYKETNKYVEHVHKTTELYELALYEIFGSLEVLGLEQYTTILKRVFNGMQRQVQSILKISLLSIKRKNKADRDLHAIDELTVETSQQPTLENLGPDSEAQQSARNNHANNSGHSATFANIDDKNSISHYSSQYPRSPLTRHSYISPAFPQSPAQPWSTSHPTLNPQSLQTFRSNHLSPEIHSARNFTQISPQSGYLGASLMSARSPMNNYDYVKPVSGNVDEDNEALRNYLQEHENIQNEIEDFLRGKRDIERIVPIKVSRNLRQVLQGLEYTKKQVNLLAEDAKKKMFDDSDDDEDDENKKGLEEMGDRIKQAFSKAKVKAVESLETALKSKAKVEEVKQTPKAKANSKTKKPSKGGKSEIIMKDACTFMLDNSLLEQAPPAPLKKEDSLKKPAASNTTTKAKGEKEVSEKEFTKLSKDYAICIQDKRELGQKVVKLETELYALKEALLLSEDKVAHIQEDLEKKTVHLQKNHSANKGLAKSSREHLDSKEQISSITLQKEEEIAMLEGKDRNGAKARNQRDKQEKQRPVDPKSSHLNEENSIDMKINTTEKKAEINSKNLSSVKVHNNEAKSTISAKESYEGGISANEHKSKDDIRSRELSGVDKGVVNSTYNSQLIGNENELKIVQEVEELRDSTIQDKYNELNNKDFEIGTENSSLVVNAQPQGYVSPSNVETNSTTPLKNVSAVQNKHQIEVEVDGEPNNEPIDLDSPNGEVQQNKQIIPESPAKPKDLKNIAVSRTNRTPAKRHTAAQQNESSGSSLLIQRNPQTHKTELVRSPNQKVQDNQGVTSLDDFKKVQKEKKMSGGDESDRERSVERQREVIKFSNTKLQGAQSKDSSKTQKEKRTTNLPDINKKEKGNEYKDDVARSSNTSIQNGPNSGSTPEPKVNVMHKGKKINLPEELNARVNNKYQTEVLKSPNVINQNRQGATSIEDTKINPIQKSKDAYLLEESHREKDTGRYSEKTLDSAQEPGKSRRNPSQHEFLIRRDISPRLESLPKPIRSTREATDKYNKDINSASGLAQEESKTVFDSRIPQASSNKGLKSTLGPLLGEVGESRTNRDRKERRQQAEDYLKEVKSARATAYKDQFNLIDNDDILPASAKFIGEPQSLLDLKEDPLFRSENNSKMPSELDLGGLGQRKNRMAATVVMSKFNITNSTGTNFRRKLPQNLENVQQTPFYKNEMLMRGRLQIPISGTGSPDWVNENANTDRSTNRRHRGRVNLSKDEEYFTEPVNHTHLSIRSYSPKICDFDRNYERRFITRKQEKAQLTIDECIRLELIREAENFGMPREDNQYRVMYRSMLTQAKQHPKVVGYIRKLVKVFGQIEIEPDHPVVEYEAFETFVKKYIDFHAKCGDKCIHLKTFFMRIGYNYFYRNRVAVGMRKANIKTSDMLLGFDMNGTIPEIHKQSPKFPNINKKKLVLGKGLF